MAKNEILILLTEWKQNLKVSRATHYETAKQLSKENSWLGIPAIVLSAIVGTSILVTVQETVSSNLKVAAGLISVLAAVFAGIQTLLHLEERAEKHRTAAARYSALIRKIDEVLAFYRDGEIQPDVVKSIREEYDKVSLEAPPTSQKFYEKAIRVIKTQNTTAEELKKAKQ